MSAGGRGGVEQLWPWGAGRAPDSVTGADGARQGQGATARREDPGPGKCHSAGPCTGTTGPN